MTPFTLPSIPGELHWKNHPVDWRVEPENRFTIVAGAHTNWFIDPGGAYTQDSAPSALLAPPDARFLLSAKVAVEFAATFDAGVLQVRERDDWWAKLCFEYSPQGQPMIVSVVTRGLSDDCNSEAIAGNEVYLRIAKTPGVLAFHFSRDGCSWRLVRYFTLGELGNLRVGFSSQSPRGLGCKTVFSEISYRPGSLKDYRSGE
jgi:regulation of enolase protein 1 (concanavalin A-like superfamily)